MDGPDHAANCHNAKCHYCGKGEARGRRILGRAFDTRHYYHATTLWACEHHFRRLLRAMPAELNRELARRRVEAGRSAADLASKAERKRVREGGLPYLLARDLYRRCGPDWADLVAPKPGQVVRKADNGTPLA